MSRYRTSGYVWASWSNGTTTTTASTSNQVWYAWTGGETSATSTTGTTVVWQSWVNVPVSGSVTYRYQPVQETEAQRQARELREEQGRIQMEERIRFERESLQRANDLLVAHLSVKQLKTWQKEKFFDVMSKSGKRYRITDSRSMNVLELEGEKAIRRHCIVSRESVPLPDQLLMQKFMLETDEAEFMRVANHGSV